MIWTTLILFPHTSNPHIKEALLYIFEDNEAVDQDDYKGKKPDNETRFQNPQS